LWKSAIFKPAPDNPAVRTDMPVSALMYAVARGRFPRADGDLYNA